MSNLTFKFTIQPYQTEAVDSVVNVFAGQGYNDRYTYRRDIGGEPNQPMSLFFDQDLFTGFANSSITLNSHALLRNIQTIQKRNNIHVSNQLTPTKLGACALDIEMETGTGKTYVYIKTMFELNKRYGWSKFIVVVPSIAIREGVRKSFETMQSHFMEYYGKKARFFVYDSKNLADIDNFSQSADINVMIINMQAFNARGKDARRIRTELDAFGSRRPIDVIKANRPIVILDEPQKMGGVATQKSLQDFNPLFTLNYSATHKEHHDIVYVLDALDAANKKLVKHIEVKGIELKNLGGTDSYLYLESIVVSPTRPPMARMEFEIKYNSAIKRETKLVAVDDDLFVLSKNMEQYRGYHISDIDPIQGTVTFTNGKVLASGNVSGDISESDLRRVQIRETIRSHFEKEKELYARGIKTLSLFFIDEVAKYRKYDKADNEVNSVYGDMFEEEYTDILNEYLTLFDTPYEQYLRSIDVHKTHAGYFSIDKKGHKIDSLVKRGQEDSDDIAAYDLILKDKEKLLSFDNPVRFIFSHSALREGWDNPNIFQICTLKHSGNSSTQKRQEVGRGLRLCVNQNGDRQDINALGDQVQQINTLTVISSGSYAEFVEGLQEGMEETLYDRPKEASIDYFTGRTLHLDSEDITLSEKQGRYIYQYLVKNDYIDGDNHITEKYQTDLENKTLATLPESVAALADGIHALIQSIYDKHALDGLISNGRNTKIQENKLNENFSKKEFQTLWNYINHKCAYRVTFDSQELIDHAIRHINDKLQVPHLQFTVTSGLQKDNLTKDTIERGLGFEEKSSQTEVLRRSKRSPVTYDLVGQIATGTKLTRHTIVQILSGISPAKFALFKTNPEEFIRRTIILINEKKAQRIVEHISYSIIDGTYDRSIFTAEKNTDFSKAYRAKKNVQDYVFTDGYAKDGQSVERKFAEKMDTANEVCVYAKLPKGFSIPTPVGNYSPDWAIAFNQGTVKHIYFIAETKGTLSTLGIRDIENAKIDCAKKLFQTLSHGNITYDTVTSYQELMNLVKG